MKKLPEFGVTLQRLKPGEQTYPINGDIPNHEYQGRRTKLGGEPDWDQGDDAPSCPGCARQMTFVAQIDSVEHDWRSNPHRVDSISPKQMWMFGDVGMIYVFFCFECCETQSVFQCG